MKISTKRALRQLKEDLTGKDSHSGITLSYAWLANQLGHIFLGIIPTFFLFYFFDWNPVNSAICISIGWLIFEIFNFYSSLFGEKSNSNQSITTEESKAKFEAKWINVAFDTFTDVCFFALGAFIYCLTITKGTSMTVIIVLIGLIIYLFLASRYWFLTKMYQFYARYPFQFRLSQWSFHINAANKDKVDIFLASNKNDGNHLLVYGDFGTGKTSLGVGILTELSIKHHSCLYKNGMKMFNAFFDDDEIEDYEIWNWRRANFLMIDDVNPSKPIQNELVSPQKLLSFIDTLEQENAKNRKTLLEKNIIWILGNTSAVNKEDTDQWINMLLTIGVNRNKISTIYLSEK